MKYILYFNLLLFCSCSFQSDHTNGSEGANRFSIPANRTIADLQDKRMNDSLIIFAEQNPQYRAEVAMALASVQDPESISFLKGLLSDTLEAVRLNSAFALGQTFDSTASNILFNRLSKEKSSAVKAIILEALGKTIKKSQLNSLISFTPESAKEAEGFAYALYRAGIRGLFNRKGTVAIINMLDTATTDTKLIAAHYLSRVNFETIPVNGFEVLNKTYSNEDVRMAVALAFRKTPSLVAINGLKYLLQDEVYRVRINAIRAIPKLRINSYISFLDTLIVDANINTSIATANKISECIDFLSHEKLNSWLQQDDLNWRTEALLLKAAIKKDPDNDALIGRAKQAYLSSKDPYEQAALLTALGETFRAHKFLITETFKAPHPAVSTAGLKALVTLRMKENFPDALKPTFRDVFIMAIESADVAMMDIAARILREPKLNYKQEIKNTEFLKAAIKSLQLPQHNETLLSLEKTLAYYENRKPEPVINPYNNPVDWKAVGALSMNKNVVIETGKGSIRLNLLINEAPGSVMNFMNLAKSGYYNNKVFHRVVPNFVVQAGGNRGDGWGSENFSLRSEFSNLRFTTGTVAMASAGKDTEGTQWFITHSPTPHLEGRYTIFARVIEGMEVVHQLEQGDIIYSIKLN